MRLVGSPFSLFLLVLALASTTRIYAQSTEGKPLTQPAMYRGWSSSASFDSDWLLRQLDKDRDGNITHQEWERFFVDRDLNLDQRLSPEEIQAISQQRGGEELNPDAGRLAAFDRLDVDRNDAIDLSEWPGQKRDFQNLDADHNRTLSLEEFLSKNARWWNETFENLDFNKNGVIARSEWLDSSESFDRLDRDHNGAIDRREFYNPR